MFARLSTLTRRRLYNPFKMSSSSSPSPSNSGDQSNPNQSRNSDIQALFSMMEEGIPPRVLLSHMAPKIPLPPQADDMLLWRLLVSLIEPPKRKKLPQYNTLEDAIELIKKSNKIVVLSGAGISTSAGLPDFRSRDGIYVQIHAEHPDLNDPKSMFDIEYFRKNPLPFYQFAKALYPGQYKPTIGHKFIKSIEDHSKLLRNYSQNIDTLEKQAGIKNVIECHGSFAHATCTNCKYNSDCDSIRVDILNQKVPLCPRCHGEGNEEKPRDGLGVMKPNIVFFGEQLGDDFHVSLDSDKEEVDLLIVIGSSLKVRPVALIPKHIPAKVPQILINKEPLDHMSFDIELLGNCDDIIQELCFRLGGSWVNICEPETKNLNQISGIPELKPKVAKVPNSSVSIREKEVQTRLPPVTDEKKSPDGEQDDVSMSSERGEIESCKSNQVNIASEGTEQNVIDKLDTGNIIGAISDCDQNSDADWEDVEVLDEYDVCDMADIVIPENSYYFLQPNRYMFQGTELTLSQYENYNKDKNQ